MSKRTKRTNGKKNKMTLKKRVAKNKIRHTKHKLRHTKHRLVKSTVYTGGVFGSNIFKFTKSSRIQPTEEKKQITFDNGDKYIGDFKEVNGEILMNGHGKLSYANGDVYEGNFENGIINGQGKLTHENGDVYEGNFIKGNLKLNGPGKFKFNREKKGDGYVYTVYDGNFKDGKFDGKGKVTYKNGDIYEGDYKNDFLDGPGTLKFNKEIINGHKKYDVYEGNFKFAQKGGFGKITYKNGDIYEGNFKDDKYNGQGNFTYANGNVYDGNFKDDNFDGQGKLTFTNGDIYEGNFENDNYNGQGIFKFNKEKIDGNDVWDVYKGEFKENNFDGEGNLTYKNGGYYDGNFEKGYYNGIGKGKIIYKDGGIYEGDFKDYEYSGKGKLTYENGDVYEGKFKENDFDGPGILTYANGNVKEGNFKDGKTIGQYEFFYNLKNKDVKKELKKYINPGNENKENEKLFIQLVDDPNTEIAIFVGEKNINNNVTGHFLFYNKKLEHPNKKLINENEIVFRVRINEYDNFSLINISDKAYIHKKDVEHLTTVIPPKQNKEFFEGYHY